MFMFLVSVVCPYVVYLGAKCILSYDKYVSYKGLLVDIFSLVNYVDGEEGGRPWLSFSQRRCLKYSSRSARHLRLVVSLLR